MGKPPAVKIPKVSHTNKAGAAEFGRLPFLLPDVAAFPTERVTDSCDLNHLVTGCQTQYPYDCGGRVAAFSR